jgi:hypothetical protein
VLGMRRDLHLAQVADERLRIVVPIAAQRHSMLPGIVSAAALLPLAQLSPSPSGVSTTKPWRFSISTCPCNPCLTRALSCGRASGSVVEAWVACVRRSRKWGWGCRDHRGLWQGGGPFFLSSSVAHASIKVPSRKWSSDNS